MTGLSYRFVSIGFLCLGALFVPVAQGDVEVVDESQIYYGDSEFCENPGCISGNEVFLAIPAYRKIVEEGIPKSDPRYWLLMEEANRVFRRVLKKTDRDHGYDLIGELGSIQIDGRKAPDITAKVVEVAKECVRDER